MCDVIVEKMTGLSYVDCDCVRGLKRTCCSYAHCSCVMESKKKTGRLTRLLELCDVIVEKRTGLSNGDCDCVS